MRGAYEEYLGAWDRHGAEWEHWVERTEAFRSAVARLFAVSSDEVAVQTSVSAAVSALVSGLDFSERTQIVISEYEFPTVGQIAHAQELRGAEIVHADATPEAVEKAINERTALVCTTLVSYRTGRRHDVESIYDIARRYGAVMLVDAYQAVGAVPLNASAVGDVVVGGTVKYLLASAGLAYMYVRADLTTNSSRHRRVGSRTRTSSTCRYLDTAHIDRHAVSTPARHRSPTSTRQWLGLL